MIYRLWNLLLLGLIRLDEAALRLEDLTWVFVMDLILVIWNLYDRLELGWLYHVMIHDWARIVKVN